MSYSFTRCIVLYYWPVTVSIYNTSTVLYLPKNTSFYVALALDHNTVIFYTTGQASIHVQLKTKFPTTNLYTLARICKEAPKTNAKPSYIYKQTARALLPLQRRQGYGVCDLECHPCLYNHIRVVQCFTFG